MTTLRAAGAHGAGERARAGVERDPGLEHLVDHLFRQALEQLDALAQRRLELDLAAHRALGDGRDVGAQADQRRELVDAFLADQGRVHVGHHEPLLAPRERLDDDVDRFAGEIRRERGAPGVEVSGHDEVGCYALVEPAPALDAAEG